MNMSDDDDEEQSRWVRKYGKETVILSIINK